VDIGAETLFDGANGTFDLSNMTIGSDDVNVDGGQGLSKVAKFMIPMNVNNLETTCSVEFDHSGKFGENGFDGTVSDGNGGAEADVAGDSVEETMVHDKEEVDA
jgi:hypothetical protein